MIKYIKSLLFKKKQPVKLYPVAGEKKRRIEYTQAKDVALFLLLIILITAMSCSPTASLPNGCTYKINAPKFKK